MHGDSTQSSRRRAANYARTIRASCAFITRSHSSIYSCSVSKHKGLLDTVRGECKYSTSELYTCIEWYSFPTHNCTSTVILVLVQSIVGLILEALMTGYVFAKLSMPLRRAYTIVFSQCAVIKMRNGKVEHVITNLKQRNQTPVIGSRVLVSYTVDATIPRRRHATLAASRGPRSHVHDWQYSDTRRRYMSF